MAVQSAGLLPYRRDAAGLHVFLVHMGGPFWARRDDGAWSVAKGLTDDCEDPADAARREFVEEVGAPDPPGELVDLGSRRMPSGKVVRVFAVEAPASLAFVASNTFALEWPRGSGRVQDFPEVDRAAWFTLDEARTKLVGGQVGFLDTLAGLVGG